MWKPRLSGRTQLDCAAYQCITSVLPAPRLRPSCGRVRALVLRQVMQDGMRTTPGQRLRLIAIVGCPAIFGTCVSFHSANRRVDSDPAAQANLAAAKQEAQPLLDALEKYRGDTGLYPPTLDKLVPAYLSSLRGIRIYRYSARRFKQDCLTGFRFYNFNRTAFLRIRRIPTPSAGPTMIPRVGSGA